jgi:adenine deaminase
MDLAINNVLIPDFAKLSFTRGNIGIEGDTISTISDVPLEADTIIDGHGGYLTPGLIDTHCHIESSYLLPSMFGNALVKHGVLHAVCDCHEVSNVKGREGLEFFINESKNSACNIKFAVPSSVPATDFATSGGRIDVEDVEYFLKFDEVVALGELMNVPAVINRDEKFMKMIALAKKHKKKVNGHAPSLTGDALDMYISAGVDDDHESESYDELKEKLNKGLNVFIREGSAEKTEDDAYRIINEYPDNVMFCTDDESVGDIVNKGNVSYNLRKAISLGIEPILAFKVASYNGLKYYGLDEFSQIKLGNKASMVIFDENFNVKTSIINGKIFKDTLEKPKLPEAFLHTINLKPIIEAPKIKNNTIAISVKNGSLITDKIEFSKNMEIDVDGDILKLCLFERYGHNRKSACFIKGFGLKKGAIATSLSHDCHNILAVGTSDSDIIRVVNKIIETQGGLALFDGNDIYTLNLNVCGIVSQESAEKVAKNIELLKNLAKDMGSKMDDAFASLSFMALEVIPHLKLTDFGLFDVDRFEYVQS